MKGQKIIASILVIGLLFTSINSAKADPINSINGFTPAKGQGIFAVQYRSLHLTSSVLNQDIGATFVPTVLGYGITEKLTAVGVVAWRATELQFDDPFSGDRIQRDGAGLGDTEIYFTYRFLTHDTASSTQRWQAYLGLGVPAGRDAVSDRFGRLPASLQPSGGVLYPIYGLSYKYSNLDYQFDFSTFYDQFTTENDISPGNLWAFNFALARRIWPWTLPEFEPDSQLTFMVELVGSWTGNTEILGVEQQDTNGFETLIAPGLQFTHKNLVLDASVQLPIITNTQVGTSETDINLISGFRIYL